MTESDRALLALAAQAAGYDVYWDEDSESYLHRNPTVRECGGWRMTFDPLSNDGDAFRLAMALHMGVKANGPDNWQRPNCTLVDYETDCPRRLVRRHDNDAQAATRRAIVRAAAEIAKAQQGEHR